MMLRDVMTPLVCVLAMAGGGDSCLLAGEQAAGPGLPGQRQTLVRACLAARQMQKELEGTRKIRVAAVARGFASKLGTELAAVKGPGAGVLRYYRGRLLVLAFDLEEADEALLSLVADGEVAPEAIGALRTLDAAIVDRARSATHMMALGKLVPCGHDGRMLDASSTYPPHRGRFSRQEIPQPRLEALLEIADLLSKGGAHGLAGKAYVEAIYLGLWVEFAYGGHSGWLSPRGAGLWLKAAQAFWRGGQPGDALACAAKAAIFGDEDASKRALELLRSPGAGTQGAQKPPKLEANAVRRILDDYAAMNMHPRGLLLLKQSGGALGEEARELETSYRKEWLRRVNDHCSGRQRCFLFGQDVLPEAKRASVRIPWPCEKEALQEVRRLYRKEEQEPPGKGKGAKPEGQKEAAAGRTGDGKLLIFASAM